MAENINIGMAPSGEEKVKQSLKSVEEQAKKITMRFKEATEGAKKTGKDIQNEVGGKGRKAVEDTEKAAARMGNAIKSALSVAVVGQFIREVDKLKQKMAERSGTAATTLVGTTFGTGDLASSQQIRQSLANIQSPLTFEQRVGVFGSVRDSAPLADRASIMRVTERIVGHGGVAAGMDPGNITRLSEYSGELIAHGLSPDEATDVAANLLQIAGNQKLDTKRIGIADMIGQSLGMRAGRQATMAGLPYVLAGHRQGLEPPRGGDVTNFMSRIRPELVSEFQRSMMGSRGALDRARETALQDPAYRALVRRRELEASIGISDAFSVSALDTAEALAEQARIEASLAAEDRTFQRSARNVLDTGTFGMAGIVERGALTREARMRRTGRPSLFGAAGRENMATMARTGRPISDIIAERQAMRIRIESDDPSARLAGSGD